jgi:hypothetical protein
MLEWIQANRSQQCGADAMDPAAGQGHLEAVKWLHANRTEGCSDQAIQPLLPDRLAVGVAQGACERRRISGFRENVRDAAVSALATGTCSRFLETLRTDFSSLTQSWLNEHYPRK